MKRTLSLLVCALVALPCLLAQKKPLDHSVYDSWQSVGETVISPAGRVLAYEVNPQEGDGLLTIQVLGKKSTRTIEIPRGYRVSILDDESYAVCLIKPFFKETRKARIAKKKDDQLPKDSLAVINLTTGEVLKFGNVKGYKAAKHGLKAVAFVTADTTFIPQKERKNKDIGGPLAVYHFASGSMDTLRHISEYGFSKDGLQLGLVQKEDKFRTLAGVYDVLRRESRFFPDTAAWHAVPQRERLSHGIHSLQEREAAAKPYSSSVLRA
jgi:hypothetical protein